MSKVYTNDTAVPETDGDETVKRREQCDLNTDAGVETIHTTVVGIRDDVEERLEE